MKIYYEATNQKDPLYLENSNNRCRVLLVFYDQGNLYVYYTDEVSRSVYINRIEKTSILDEALSLNHCKYIESDEEWSYYNNFIQDNYNFNGLHKDENIDAHKYGGAVLVDLEGNSLIHGKIGKL